MHARPLPHVLGDFICNVAVFFGGGRIGTFSLPPHIEEGISGGGGTGPLPHNVSDFFAFYCIVDDCAWECLDRSIAPTTNMTSPALCSVRVLQGGASVVCDNAHLAATPQHFSYTLRMFLQVLRWAFI